MFKSIKSRKKLEEKRQNDRRISLNFLHKLAASSGNTNTNSIYLPYEYNDYMYNLIRYRVNMSGNIELYCENGQLIFAGVSIFELCDFMLSIISDREAFVMEKAISALKCEYA